jgi:hypothetical protein
MIRIRPWWLLVAVIIVQPVLAADDEFVFDAGAYQKKEYSFSGYVELRPDQQALNPNSAAYQLGFIGLPDRNTLNHNAASILLNGNYEKDHWQLAFTAQGANQQDELVSQQTTDLYEAYAAYKPAPDRTWELGKRTLKWGKGYAWNPVGFVERPKDPDEPDLAREGYVMATADLIKSYSGKLTTLTLTPVYLPVRSDLNTDYGSAAGDNLALKLYLLYNNSDIDLVYLNDASRSQRFGIDFARNLQTNFEIHGEWAYLTDFDRTVVDSSGAVSTETVAGHQFLAGLRYLTENETTIIAEVYHNQVGYTAAQMEDFFTAVHTADATSNTTLLNQLANLAPKTYLKRTPGQNYLYLRLSNKEPFDWLYYTPAITFISNLDDDSYSVTPELVYTGFKNLELRFKATWLQGSRLSELGEKRNQRKIEFRLRYFY